MEQMHYQALFHLRNARMKTLKTTTMNADVNPARRREHTGL